MAQQTTKQRLALAICDFLTTATTDGTVSADERDSLEVAVNCIAESFHVDPTDKAAVAAAVGDQSLVKIYGVYEKLKGTSTASTASAASAGSASASASASTSTPTPAPATAPAEASPETKKEADALKSRGNAAMAQKDYAAAIDLYSQALAKVPDNAVYLSNRAAAYSAAKDHTQARADAEAAVALDPAYTKAWSRLGLAKFALGDAKGAMAAYEQGIAHEGNGGSEAMRKGYETAKRRAEELDGDAVTRSAAGGAGAAAPDASAGGNPFAGLGGGGGMPDLGAIMNNPMFASMAQNLMSNPDMMSNLMNNPRLREMANQFGGGGGGGGAGGMPDLSALMSDPSIADLARNMMGGAGGAGRGSQ